MAFSSPFARPDPLAPPAVPPAPTSPPALPPPTRRGRRAPIWLFALLVLLAAVLIAYLLTFLGAAASVLSAVLALLPLAAVLLAVRLVDRWEPEPASLRIAAVAWGAVAAVVLALAVDLGITLLLGVADSPGRQAFSAVVQAPIVEELAKGAGVLLLLAVGRRAFDGPVDGVVYGALVGAGFAFTENILYFAESLAGGAEQVTMTFLLRGILSPFAHVMFTAVTGYALGLAARRGVRGSGVLRSWIGGLLGAVALHALWNGSSVFGDFFALYGTLQVPLFVAFVVGVTMLRREEARLTRARLGEYADAGWFSPAEVDMLATPRGRRAGLAWARSLPGDRSAAMRTFLAEATALAAARQRAATGRDPRAAADEQAYLARAVAARAALVAPAGRP
jgi:RsiW-degrading membrane proteinase PrsW (M82 family)